MHSYSLRKMWENNMTFDLNLWSIYLNINKDYWVIKDYLCTKFEASWTKHSWIMWIHCIRCGSRIWPHKITSKLLTQGYRYHKLPKAFGKSFWTGVKLWPFVQIWWNIVSSIYFWRNLWSCPLWRSGLQTEKGQRRSKFRLVGL